MKAQRFSLCVALALTYGLLLQTVPAALEETPPPVSLDELKVQFLPVGYTKSNVTLEDAKRLLRLKCKRAGVELTHVYEELEAAVVLLLHCISNIVNLTELYNEVEAAKPYGDLDLVLQKYCSRQPLAEQCLVEFNAKLLPCLTQEERTQNTIMLRIIISLLEFICHQNGAQVALFIAEEGPECIEGNKENIALCMNATFGTYMAQNGAQMPELPELVLRPKQCIDMHDFEQCVLGHLEMCDIVTPSNIVEALFRYVRKESKCQAEINKVFGGPKKKFRSSGNINKLHALLNMISIVLVGVTNRNYF